MAPRGVDYASVVHELKEVRRAGMVRLRELRLPALTEAASAGLTPDGPAVSGPSAVAVERLLRLAVDRLGGGSLQEAAEYTLGTAPGTRDWPGSDRRRRAAGVYGVSVERFRKHQEGVVLGQIAEQILRLCGEAPPTESPLETHRVLRVPAAGRVVPVTLHVHAVDLLSDVDVIVVPSNTHFALPEAYKSSVSASLRRAAASRSVTGELLADPVREELRDWAVRQGTSGRPVVPGTVAATGSGALAAQGVRRLYHAAVAVPRSGTNDYDVLPADVTRAVTRVLALLAEESRGFDPPLRSVCLPLLGSGRGGLSYQQSIEALWPAVDAELSRRTDLDIHLIVRHPVPAELLLRTLTTRNEAQEATGIRPDPAHIATGPSGGLERTAWRNVREQAGTDAM
ncbi:hypothetical protein [Streptomyces sp. NPDC056670]|uniref:hypothetical protein n=1 Tax=Streptomyces sp. NPDC056670 TaxID=3345904 RepID=UPI003681DF82